VGAQRILVVDDDPFLLEGIVRYLSPLAPVDGVGSGEEARFLVRRHSYAVAVMDVNVGKENGIDIVLQLAAEQPSRIGAVVFHTGVVPVPEPPLGLPVPHVVVSKGDIKGLRNAVCATIA